MTASPVVAADDAATYSTDGHHEAPELEATLSVGSPVGSESLASVAGEAAATEWDEDFILHYILASTCREPEDFEMAVRYGERPARALRFADADGERLREAYLQARRFAGPAGDVAAAPYGWFTATAGWRPATIVLDGRTVVDYATDSEGFFAYFAGDTIYEIGAAVDDLRDTVKLLPEPAGDHDLPMPTVPAPLACPQADAELLAFLPDTLGDHELEPYPLPPGFARRFLRDVEMTGDLEAASGYLLFATVGSLGAAFRVPGAKRPELRRACRALLDLRKDEARVVDWGGRRVLTNRSRDTACYVREDAFFGIAAPGLAKRIIRSIPLPGTGAGMPSAPSEPSDGSWSESNTEDRGVP